MAKEYDFEFYKTLFVIRSIQQEGLEMKKREAEAEVQELTDTLADYLNGIEDDLGCTITYTKKRLRLDF